MSLYRALNVALQVPPVAVALFALYSMFTGGIYTYISLVGVPFHAWTAVVIISVYEVALSRLQNIAVPIRQIYAYAMMLASMQLYEMTYAVFALATHHKWSMLPFISFTLTCILLSFLESREMFLKSNLWSWFMLGALIGCYLVLTWQGFFDMVTLYEDFAGSDPNMNPVWLISKVAGFLVFPLSTTKGRENKSVRFTLS